jgi:hypothetical protein
MRSKLIKQPLKPRINYYSEPDLFPFTLPIMIGLSALGFAAFGTGTYADKFRTLIKDIFGPGMLPGAKWLVIIMVSLLSILTSGTSVFGSVPHLRA